MESIQSTIREMKHVLSRACSRFSSLLAVILSFPSGTTKDVMLEDDFQPPVCWVCGFKP